MKRILALSLFAFTFASLGFSSNLCVDDVHLSDAIAAGGCTYNDLFFDNFSYSFTGTGTAIPATMVSLTLSDPDSLTIGTLWQATEGRSRTLTFSFDVTDFSGLLTSLSSFYALGQADGLIPWDSANGNSQPANTGPSNYATVCTNCAVSPVDFGQQTVLLPSPIAVGSTIHISNTIVLGADSAGTDHVSAVVNDFSDDPVMPLPEPGALMLVLGGLLAMAAKRRCQS